MVSIYIKLQENKLLYFLQFLFNYAIILSNNLLRKALIIKDVPPDIIQKPEKHITQSHYRSHMLKRILEAKSSRHVCKESLLTWAEHNHTYNKSELLKVISGFDADSWNQNRKTLFPELPAGFSHLTGDAL